jgi:moderate conductance mechanosensitive channel
MPSALTEIFGLYAPFVIPLIHIAGMLLAAFVLMKIIDSGLKRLPMLVPPGELPGMHRFEQRAMTLRHVIRSVSKAVIIVILALTISAELGFDLTGLLATVGIASIAIGFGAQSLVKDVISGFFILFEDQFGVGDVVQIGEHSGVVERMTLRSTVLRNIEGEVHVIPNGIIQVVTVMTKDWARAVIDLTVGHKENLDHVFKVLTSVGDQLARDWPDRVQEKPTILGVEKLAVEGLTVRLIVKTPPLKQWDVMREWRRRIKEAFDREGIDLRQTGPVPAGPSENAIRGQ